MLHKNQIEQATITAMSSDGNGIAKIDGMVVFVPYTAVGDQLQVRIVKVQKNFAFGIIDKLLQPSPDRVEDRCPVYKKCGGCAFRHISYDAELRHKAQFVEDNLRRIGGLEPKMLPITPSPLQQGYRNKAQYPVGRDREGRLTAGFYAGRTHQIIPVPDMDCALGAEENQAVLEKILAFMEEYSISPYDEEAHAGLVRHVLIRKGFTTGELMVCLVINGESIPRSDVLAERLSQIPGMTSITCSINREKTNVIMGNEIRTIWGQSYITDYIGPVKFHISPLSFFQVNPVQTEKLYGAALEFAGLTGKETVWDLYCGIGTISLFLAREAGQVYGVEIVPQAIEDAKNNAAVNDIDNARFHVGKAEEVLPGLYEKEGIRADVIVVDPPRKGCEQAVLETMVKMQPERIVYVSCDPATLARDVKYLRESGYEIKRVKAVDMFPHTVHVETVCLLSNRKPDTKVRVDVDLEDYYRIKDAEKNQN